MPEVSKIHFNIPARGVRQVPKNLVKGVDQAKRLGFGVANMSVARDMAMAYAADAATGTITTATIPGVIQFLQNWLPGQVHVMTAARKIDSLVGIQTIGSYEDEEVVQTVLEKTAYAVPYGDLTNLPLTNWNPNFVRRTVVRMETGMRVGNIEEARAARIRVNSGEMKREACGEGLEIERNLIGFNGFNSGNNNTYGFLNDPGLPAYVTVAAGAGAGTPTVWSGKTFLEICKDIRTAIATLRTQSKDTIDVETVPLTMAVPTNAKDYLSTTSDFGVSVWNWLKSNYPNIRVESAPQLNTANSSAGVFYLYADTVVSSSTDGGAVFAQVVPAKFIVEGVQKLVKGYEEGYLNATAGVMCKRPFAVVRFTGIS